MNRNTHDMLARLESLGITRDDAIALRRIAMTLHRWHELECGDGNDHSSWCITRGKRENGEFRHDDNGAPYLERHYHQGKVNASYSRIPDRETGARRRLFTIMTRYPTLQPYIQGDPRGAALYILRPGDVPEGADPDSYYSRGIAVYR